MTKNQRMKLTICAFFSVLFLRCECGDFAEYFDAFNSLSAKQKKKKMLTQKHMKESNNDIKSMTLLQLDLFSSGTQLVSNIDNSAASILNHTNKETFDNFVTTIQHGHYIEAMHKLVELSKDGNDIVTYVRCLFLANLIYKPMCDILSKREPSSTRKQELHKRKQDKTIQIQVQIEAVKKNIAEMLNDIDTTLQHKQIQDLQISKQQWIDTSYDDLLNCILLFGGRTSDARHMIEYVHNNCKDIDCSKYPLYERIVDELRVGHNDFLVG